MVISAPPPMKIGRGATRAMNSWLSTGISLAEWPTAAYLRKLPANQWNSLGAATLPIVSP